MYKCVLKKVTIENEKLNFLQKLHQEYANDDFVKIDFEKEKNDFDLYVLYLGEKEIGWLSVKMENNGTIVFHQVLIDENFRNRGYGQVLLNEGFKLAKSLNCKKVVLASRPGKEHFYFKNGCIGEGLLQVDVSKSDQEKIEQFLRKENITNANYKIWQNSVHQFFFKLDKNFVIKVFF